MDTNGHVLTRSWAYSQVSRAYKPKRVRMGTCPNVQGRSAKFFGRTGTSGPERQGWCSQVFREYRPERARRCTCTLTHLLTDRCPGRLGPKGIQQSRASSPRGLQAGFPRVRAQMSLNGNINTRPGAYSQVFQAYQSQMGSNGLVPIRPAAYRQVFQAYRPKQARTDTCTLTQGIPARFSGHTGRKGLEWVRAYS